MTDNDKPQDANDGKWKHPKPTPIEWLMRPDMTKEPSPPPPTPKPKVHCLADLAEQPQQWLWPGRVPRGALTLICGDAGRGKSLLSLDIAARVTTGLPWPDGRPADGRGDVLLLSAEDSIGRTVRSRLVAHDANLRRVYYLNSGSWLDPTEPLETTYARHSIIAFTSFGAMPSSSSSASHREASNIKGALEMLPNCRLVVIDPMSAYMSAHGLVSVDDARDHLAPLIKIADRSGAAVIAVVHRDQAMLRPNDKRQFVLRALADMARAIYLVDRHPTSPGDYAMIPVKNNLGDAGQALTFTVKGNAEGAAQVAWNAGPLELSASELLADAHPRQSSLPRQTETDRAIAWLQGALAAGPVPSKELLERARASGISLGTLKRARVRLGIHVSKANDVSGAWDCSLPDKELPISEEAQLAELSFFDPLAPSAITEPPATNLPEESATTNAA